MGETGRPMRGTHSERRQTPRFPGRLSRAEGSPEPSPALISPHLSLLPLAALQRFPFDRAGSRSAQDLQFHKAKIYAKQACEPADLYWDTPPLDSPRAGYIGFVSKGSLTPTRALWIPRAPL